MKPEEQIRKEALNTWIKIIINQIEEFNVELEEMIHNIDKDITYYD